MLLMFLPHEYICECVYCMYTSYMLIHLMTCIFVCVLANLLKEVSNDDVGVDNSIDEDEDAGDEVEADTTTSEVVGCVIQ
jgi:hypothetical protein